MKNIYRSDKCPFFISRETCCGVSIHLRDVLCTNPQNERYRRPDTAYTLCVSAAAVFHI